MFKKNDHLQVTKNMLRNLWFCLCNEGFQGFFTDSKITMGRVSKVTEEMRLTAFEAIFTLDLIKELC